MHARTKLGPMQSENLAGELGGKLWIQSVCSSLPGLKRTALPGGMLTS